MKGNKQRSRLVWIMAVYLLGIFMGAIDTGIVSPARTIIQGMLGVGDKSGIWMITIYTLAYAAVIPISGKLADRYGRKYVYMASVGLFGLGSLVCGLSNLAGSFPLLLAGRVIQALGGGGIMPVATAEFGTSFPPEKRGMALGLVGGVYGVANILGSTIGSAILNAFGNSNWHMLFYVNVPISVLIIIGGFFTLPNTSADHVKKIDKLGTLLLVAMVLSLLYGLRNLDFFHFSDTIISASVYPFLIAFVVLLPLFLLAERRAQDPILALRYFSRRATLVTLGLSFLTGVCMMGMIFVPQFSENALKIASGSGGYFVAILGVFAGAAAPLSGVLIDRHGPKKVLFLGFGITLAGALFLALVAVNTGTWLTVIASLVMIGFGLGFTMGTPLNYMMLDNTPKEESNSALAALSLIRSVGTAIAPAIMVGFLAQAGLTTQDNLMAVLPKPQAPRLALAESLSQEFKSLQQDPNMAKMMGDAQIPDFGNMTQMDFDMSGGTLPNDVLESLQTADVTNITERVKAFVGRMFDDNTPAVITKIQDGIQSGIEGMGKGLTELDKSIADMEKGLAGIQQGIAGMNDGIAGVGKGIGELNGAITGVDAQLAATTDPKAIGALQGQKAGLEAALAEAQAKIAGLEQSMKEAQGKAAGMDQALAGMRAGRKKLSGLIDKMAQLKDSIPAAFRQSRDEYMAALDNMQPQIESTFQSGLNGGFRGMYVFTAAASVLAVAVLIFYRSCKKAQLAAA